MPNRVLGLDVGPTSVGWALVDDSEQRIVAAGVRVFPEGVDRDQQGGEQPKMAARRTARGMRRQIARRARRRQQLRGLLVRAALLPAAPDELARVMSLNPYPLRRRALDERLELHEIGRVLIHLNQRRGFLSNRKTDKARAKDTKGMLAEISTLAAAIATNGCRTLGEYLARLESGFEHARSAPDGRARHRHTRRDMYEAEFEQIWESQRKFYPTELSEELRDQLRHLIFFQRKMYWPKSVVGRCELEPRERRCPRALRVAQRFRLLCEVNNLHLLDTASRLERRLTDGERETVLKYLSTSKERKFQDIRKKLGLSEHAHFTIEGPERDKLKGHETDAALVSAKVLGKRWTALTADAKDAVVAVLVLEESEEVALRQLTEQIGLTSDEAQRALGVHLPDGYMSYSRSAMEKLLPHLERGLLLMADDSSNSALHAAGYLRPDERDVRQCEFLPPAPDLPNPIVRQAVVEIRKVVNAIIRTHGRPDRIHVELAREAKKGVAERRQMRFDNADRRKAREEAARRIEELGDKPTGGKIERYLLWQEQGEECVYSGRKISVVQLLSDAVSVDHILPRWRSLDDSRANKVVVFREENDQKADRTPRDWLETSDPPKYEAVLQRAARLPGNKRRKFIQQEIVLDDFVNRQLTDTAYISRLTTQYLRRLGVPIVTPRGQMTADLRHFWGLNNILDPEGRGQKNRADHRHHAVDALVIALTDAKRLHALANDRGRNVKPPWDGFFEDGRRAIQGINVSHRVQRRLRGALHEETFYGATQKRPSDVTTPGSAARPWAKGWVEAEQAFVRRKDVTDLTDTKHLEKVRDAAIQKLLREHLRRRGVDPDQPGKIPGDAFKGENVPRMASGVPIRKVRMIEEGETFRPVSERRSYQNVKPGSNHHIVYRAAGTGENEHWTAEVVTMWDAAHRARKGAALVDQTDSDAGRFVMSLTIGETFEIDGTDGERLVCVVQKMRQDNGRLNYKLHMDARPSSDIVKDNLVVSPERMRLWHARKVTVDALGRIRWASD